MKRQWVGTALAGITILCLASCSEPTPEQKQRSEDFNRIFATKKLVSERLRDPKSADFGKVVVSRHSGNPIVCGYVNATNGFGGRTGEQEFIGIGGLVVFAEDLSSKEFVKLWNENCVG